MAARTGSVIGSRRRTWRERTGVLVVAGTIVGAVGAYLVLTNASGGSGSAKNLLPYQTLAASLPVPDQQTYTAIRAGQLVAEADRARSFVWPDPDVLAGRGVAPFAPSSDAPGYRWTRLQEGTIIDYVGTPADASQPAWLLEIQEPEPGMPPDPAPPDEEHHRLPDGTTVHVYVWMHPYGGQVPAAFVRQPQTSGWTEVFSAPPNPVYYSRR